MYKLNPITGRMDIVRNISDNPDSNTAEESASTKATKTLSTAINAIIGERKEYIVKLTQIGTDAPSVVVIKDTIPTPTVARSGVGTYTITKAGAFTANKTMPDKLEFTYDVDGNYITIERTSADVITIKTYGFADTTVLADAILSNQIIIIEIYS